MTRLAAAWIVSLACALCVSAQAELPELHTPMSVSAPNTGDTPSLYPLLPEGTYLTDRQIRVIPLGTRALAAVFLRSEGESAVRPMALLPCSNTQAIEQLARSESSDVVFEVSGQVFVSRGLNYFLPMIVRVISPLGSPAPAALEAETLESLNAEEAPAGDAETSGEAESVDAGLEAALPPALAERTPERDVSVEELIRQLDAATVAAAPARGEDADGRPLTLQREGGVVTLRRGRLTSGTGGAPVFTFDNGVETDVELEDPPMGLLPCSLTDEMERIASDRGDHVTLTVSGRVFLYDESNYLLPTMFFVNRSGEGGFSSAQ